jgi:hypothetical protein
MDRYLIENANRKVWVLASPEILEELRKGWSRPVQAHADENPDGSWEMTFRTYNSEREDALQRLSEQSERLGLE